jgi:hypothetical protein
MSEKRAPMIGGFGPRIEVPYQYNAQMSNIGDLWRQKDPPRRRGRVSVADWLGGGTPGAPIFGGPPGNVPPPVDNPGGAPIFGGPPGNVPPPEDNPFLGTMPDFAQDSLLTGGGGRIMGFLQNARKEADRRMRMERAWARRAPAAQPAPAPAPYVAPANAASNFNLFMPYGGY